MVGLGCGAVSVSAEPRTDLRFFAEAQVTGDYVTLGDVADLTVLPPELRGPASRLRLARFAPSAMNVSSRTDVLAARARGLMPALAPWTDTVEAGRIVVRRRPARENPGPTACLKLVRPVAMGEALTTSDVVEAPCGAEHPLGLKLDPQAGVAAAPRDLQAGEIVAHTPVLAAVRPGQQILLRAQVGPAVVERLVVAVQPARRGDAVFVQGREGAVFSAPSPDEADAR